MLLDHVAGGGRDAWRFGPLVIVSAAEGAGAEAVRSAAAARGTTPEAVGIATWGGADLGHEITAALAGDRLGRLASALSACRLIVVDRIDRVAGVDVGQALGHLLDASTAAGASWCVSLEQLPTPGLGPRCHSRLRGGLVVSAPRRAMESACGSAPSPGRVLRAVARHHDVPVAAIVGPSRRRTVAAARSLAMYLARRLTGLSLQAIGAACGGRDHTTVLHGVRVCGARLARDPALAADLERLMAELTTPGLLGTRGTRRRVGVDSAPPARGVAGRRRDRLGTA